MVQMLRQALSEVNLRTMAEMYEDSPYNGYWDM